LRAASGRLTTSYHVLIVGTNAPAETWQFICYTLNDIERLLKDASATPSTALDPFDKTTREKYHGFWTDPAQSASGPPDTLQNGNLSPDEVSLITENGDNFSGFPADSVRLPFRDIVEVFFYRGSKSPFDGRKDAEDILHQPYARLETCRAIDPDATSSTPRLPNDPPPPDRGFKVGSFIEIVAQKPDPAQPGAMLGFRGMFDVKLALNGHDLLSHPNDSALGDAYDTRGRIIVARRQANAHPSLWSYGPDIDPAHYADACIFDSIWMGWTAGSAYGHSTRSYGAVIGSGKSLVDLATQDPPTRVRYPVGEANPGPPSIISSSPLLDRLQFSLQSRPGVAREFGFRIGAYDHPEGDPETQQYPRLLLRFELYVGQFSTECLKRLANILPAALGPAKGAATTIGFAQEQRRGDVNGNFDPDAPVRWIITARIDAEAVDGGITGKVLGFFNMLVESMHTGLRAATDGQPLSFLPQIDLPTLKGEGPWHATGVLEERFAHERSAPYQYGPPSGSGRGLRARFSTFEPRFIENMWRGAAPRYKPSQTLTNGVLVYQPPKADYRAIFHGGLERLVTETGETPEYDFLLMAPQVPEGHANKDFSPAEYPAWQPSVSVNDDPFAIALGTRFALTARQLINPVDNSGVRRATAIGALRLLLSNQFSDATLDPEGFVLLRALDAEPSGSDELSGGIDAVLKYPIESVAPADQDETDSAVQISARERRNDPLDFRLPDANAPLLLPLDPPAATTGGDAILTVTAEEAFTRHRNHTLALSLSKVGQQTAPGAGATPPAVAAESPPGWLYLIDPQPFRIAAVAYPTFASTDESSQIAVWNAAGEGGLSWRIRDEGQTIRLVLPPQTIGEAMEKNRSTLPGLPKDVDPKRPAAARFGSLTELSINPSFADARFREPDWNLRRILGQAMQRSPGARLRDLRLELLYGLITRIQSPDVWYTEIAGAIGEAALPLTDVFDDSKPHLKRHALLIAAVLAAQRRRVAIDKLWKDRPDDDLTLEDGVSFQIRVRKLDHNNLVGGPETPLRWPVASKIPEDGGGLIDTVSLKATFAADDDDSSSFPGGLAWAFDSANILMSVYANPKSEGGRVRGIHLSALGGYGNQRALFDEKKTIVEAEATQGRLQRYRLERIGRIGGLLNRAKHVIVYERSVVPPAQFYNVIPIGLREDELAGRPVVRKFEEYVEILQPIRRYPEDGRSVQACGFLRGSEFKSRKIRVDSSWGADVRREGWQVPLWNKLFLALPPNPTNPDDPVNLYPKPQIRLTMVAEGGGEVACEVDEPEKLVFYTSVVKGEGEDTDSWQKVRDIDFCDCPSPTVGAMRPESADLTDAMLPAEPAHVPGWERLTIGLVPAKDGVAIASGRTEGGPAAILRNVTISRSTPLVPRNAAAADKSNAKTYGEAVALGSANLRNEIDRAVGRVLGKLEQLDRNTQRAALKQAAQDLLKQGLDAFKDARANIDRQVAGIEGIKPNFALADPCQSFDNGIRAQVRGQFARLSIVAQDTLNTAGDEILSRLSELRSFAEKANSLFKDTLQQQAAALKATLDAAGDPDKKLADLKQISRQIRAGLKSAEGQGESIHRRIDGAKSDVLALVDQAASKAQADLKGAAAFAGSGIDAVQTDISDLGARKAALLAKLKNAIDHQGGMFDQACADDVKAVTDKYDVVLGLADKAVAGMADSGAPSAAKRVVFAFDNALRGQEVTQAIAALKGFAANQVGQAVAAQVNAQADYVSRGIDDFVNRVTIIAGKGANTLDDLASKLNGLIGQAREQLTSMILPILDNMSAELDGFVNGVAGPVKTATDAAVLKLDYIIDQAQDVADQTLKTDVAAVKNAIDGAVGQIEAAADAAESGIDKKIGPVQAKVTDALAQLKAKTSEIEKVILSSLDGVVGELRKQCDKLEGYLSGKLAKLGDSLKQALGLDDFESKLQNELTSVIDQGLDQIDELKQQVASRAAELTRNMENRGRQLLGALQDTARDLIGSGLNDLERRGEGIYQQGDDAIRALRALGDPPKTDRMGFNRPEVAYVLGEAKKLGVDMTPALGLVNRASSQIAAAEKAGKAVGDLLESFGVRLPTSEIADQLIPQKLKNLSVADLIPNMGGIDFRGLLQRVGFPDLDDSNAIKVTHGFDSGNLMAWLKADMDIPFSDSAPLVEFGPVQIVIDTARFTSSARIAEGPNGSEKTMEGNIFGDWRVVCAGQTIITFRQTTLFFDHTGKIDFRIQPDRVELADALQFLTDLVEASGEDGGLAIEPLMRGGVPTGIAATLDMTLPDIQTGVFGISDLSLHILFGVAAIPQFELLGELGVGARLAPFTLNVWILNGGGYVLQRLSFLPMAKPKPALTYMLEVGIVVGVGLGFSFGVVSGGVWVQVGCSIAITWTTAAGGGSTVLRVFVLVRGMVDVAGLITASIALLLEVSYDGSNMIGAGTLTIRVKISVFYTLAVDQHVEYQFAGGKKSDGHSQSYA
jgi:hypothetical protein